MTDVVLRIVQLNAGKISPTFTVAQEPVFGSAILSRWPIDHHRHWELPLAPQPEDQVTQVPWELLHAETAGLDIFSTHLCPLHTTAIIAEHRCWRSMPPSGRSEATRSASWRR